MLRSGMLMLVVGLFLTGCTEAPTKRASNTAMAPPADGIVLPTAPKKASSPNNPLLLIDTSMGPIKVELFEDKAPITVRNILGYVEDKFYDGTIFHRVIPNFMIQCGGLEPGMKEKRTRGGIKNESDNGLANQVGTLAMARTSDPDSASSQFYINVKDNPGLDKANAEDRVGYCVFGQVLEGMDTVDKIRKVATGERGGHGDVPRQDVVIHSIRRVQ